MSPTRNILIIDDDEDFCEEMAEALKAEGYGVAFAVDPLEGEIMIKKGQYDTFLLDYKMPGLDGVEILKKIKAKGVKPKIFMISGRPFIEKMVQRQGLSDLVKGFFAKPLDMDSFLKTLQ